MYGAEQHKITTINKQNKRTKNGIYRKTTVFVSDGCSILCLKDYCKKYNLKYKLVQSRLKKGLTLENATRQAIRDEINELEAE